jgi:hypothetical protein
MAEPLTRLARVCALLNASGSQYVIVGATAMQLWGSSRATRDIDLLIEPTERNAQCVLDALGELPFGVARELRSADLLSRAVTMIGDTPNVDVLTRAWNVQWSDVGGDFVVFDVDGVPVPVLSIELLIKSKQTGRPQDVADVIALEALRRLRGEQRP